MVSYQHFCICQFHQPSKQIHVYCDAHWEDYTATLFTTLVTDNFAYHPHGGTCEQKFSSVALRGNNEAITHVYHSFVLRFFFCFGSLKVCNCSASFVITWWRGCTHLKSQGTSWFLYVWLACLQTQINTAMYYSSLILPSICTGGLSGHGFVFYQLKKTFFFITWQLFRPENRWHIDWCLNWWSLPFAPSLTITGHQKG